MSTLSDLIRDCHPDECPELPDRECFEPSDDDWAYHASLNDGGFSPDELSPLEIAMHAGTISAIDYFREYLDPTGATEEAEAQARAEMGLSF